MHTTHLTNEGITVKDSGDYLRVELTPDFVESWRKSWPCSGIPIRDHWAEFDLNGLCDRNDLSDDVDGYAHAAMFADAIAEAAKISPRLVENTAYFVACGQFK
tara:strand:- start:95 stop:403 length:309 start_codon:yes stop_codon:yes gene_type:complete